MLLIDSSKLVSAHVLAKRVEQIDEYLGAIRHVVGLLARQGKVTPATIKTIQIN